MGVIYGGPCPCQVGGPRSAGCLLGGVPVVRWSVPTTVIMLFMHFIYEFSIELVNVQFTYMYQFPSYLLKVNTINDRIFQERSVKYTLIKIKIGLT